MSVLALEVAFLLDVRARVWLGRGWLYRFWSGIHVRYPPFFEI
jgi:hypothetical protein